MSSKKYKIGIIGFGRWGIELYKFFGELDYIDIAAVCKKRRHIPDNVSLGKKSYI